MLRPRPLIPGDKIGVIAPAGPVPAEELRKGVALIEQRGYQVVIGPHVLDRLEGCNYLAGLDAHRLEDLHTLFAREDLAAIFCARGGYGSMRLFPLLDLDLLRRHPKLFVGYSDITSLHLALNQSAGLVTIHGPNLTQLPRLNERSSASFWNLLENPSEVGLIPMQPEETSTLVGGVAEGELAGGNLCLLAHACGSRFSPDLKGKLVLIEDTGEAIYRVDRFLVQLRNAGQLDQAAGFIVGTITGWREQERDPPANSPETLWRQLLEPLGKPTLIGFPFGHEPDPLSLPLGVRARLNADERTLTLLPTPI